MKKRAQQLHSLTEGVYCDIAMTDPTDEWFQRELLPHEPVLRGYLRRMWPRHDEIEDLVQETYARVYQAALSSRPSNSRAFLFATARHLLTDRIRRERIVSIQAIGDLEGLNVLVDELSAERRVNGYQELTRLADALDALPSRCREVVWLRRVEDLSYQEIAEQLGIGIKTVETHITHGMQLLADLFLQATETTASPQPNRNAKHDDEHGKR